LSRALTLIAPSCALLFLAGCPTFGGSRHDPLLQALSLGDPSLFPLHAAGYAKGEVITYDPGSGNCSVAYDRFDSELQNAVTLYSCPLLRDAATELASVERAVMQAHPGARLVSEKELELIKRATPHRALVATFEFEDEFLGERQVVSSQVVVIARPRRFVKVRSTAPVAQGARAEESMLRLLEVLGWDEDVN
jgi:hypothetical protein